MEAHFNTTRIHADNLGAHFEASNGHVTLSIPARVPRADAATLLVSFGIELGDGVPFTITTAADGTVTVTTP